MTTDCWIWGKFLDKGDYVPGVMVKLYLQVTDDTADLFDPWNESVIT